MKCITYKYDYSKSRLWSRKKIHLLIFIIVFKSSINRLIIVVFWPAFWNIKLLFVHELIQYWINQLCIVSIDKIFIKSTHLWLQIFLLFSKMNQVLRMTYVYNKNYTVLKIFLTLCEFWFFLFSVCFFSKNNVTFFVTSIIDIDWW